MGFASYAISILKSNRSLLKKTSFRGSKINKSYKKTGIAKKKILNKESIKRVKEYQIYDSFKHSVFFLIVMIVNYFLIKYLFF